MQLRAELAELAEQLPPEAETAAGRPSDPGKSNRSMSASLQ